MIDNRKFKFFKTIDFLKKLSFYNNIFLAGLWISLLIGIIFNAPKILFFLIAIGFLIAISNILIIFSNKNKIKNKYDKSNGLKDLINPDEIKTKDIYEIKDI